MSTKQALTDLGLAPCFHMEDVILNDLTQHFIDVFNGDLTALIDYLNTEGYKSTLDMPICTVFDDLLEVIQYINVSLR